MKTWMKLLAAVLVAGTLLAGCGDTTKKAAADPTPLPACTLNTGDVFSNSNPYCLGTGSWSIAAQASDRWFRVDNLSAGTHMVQLYGMTYDKDLYVYDASAIVSGTSGTELGHSVLTGTQNDTVYVSIPTANITSNTIIIRMHPYNTTSDTIGLYIQP